MSRDVSGASVGRVSFQEKEDEEEEEEEEERERERPCMLP